MGGLLENRASDVEREMGERGISSVVAIALLLAVTVVLVLVAGPFVLGIIGDLGHETPEAEFAFHYEQGDDLSTETPTDDFGTPVTEGTGLLTIKYERGETLDPANVDIRANTSGGNLLADTGEAVFASGDLLRGGDTIVVAAGQNESVDVVWTADDREAAAVLDAFTVEVPGVGADAGASGPPSANPQLPEADRGCEYIENQLESGESDNDIEVVGVVVECDLDQYYPRIEDITIESEDGNLGAVIGEVNGTGDIDIEDGGTFQGDVESGTDGDDGDVDVSGGSIIFSNVVTKGDGDVDVSEQSEVNGRIEATEKVSVAGNSTVTREITSGTGGDDGDVDVSDSAVGGDITANGDGSVDIDETSSVDGEIEAAESVSVQADSEVADKILSGTGGDDGDIDVSGSDVGGAVLVADGEGDVDIDEGSSIDGEVEATGSVSVQSNSEVVDRIVSGVGGDDGDVQVSGSDVGGEVLVADGEGDVDVSDEASIDGGIEATGSVSVQSDSEVAGSLVSGTGGDDGDVKVSGSDISGDIVTNAEADVSVGSAGSIDGSIAGNGAVDVSGGSNVAENITAPGDITIDGVTVGGWLKTTNGAQIDVASSEIGGHVRPAGDFSCDSTNINGNDCSAYKTARLKLNITDTNAPVVKGNDLTVQLRVTNVGFESESELTLLVDGVEEKRQELELAQNETDNDVEFQWATDSEAPGEYNVTVASEFDAASENATVIEESTPYFQVTIDSYDDNVSGGDDMSVTATVSNEGEEDGTQTISLRDFDGTVVDTRAVSVDNDESAQVTLTWQTTSGDTGTGQITVESDDDDATREASVEAMHYDIVDVAPFPGKGNSISVVVTVDTNDPDAELLVEAVRNSGMVQDSRRVPAETGDYSVNGANQADEVRVTLFDDDGTQRDQQTANWDG